jgi:MFS family permease
MTRKWWTLSAVVIATFMLLLDITVVNTALPKLEQGLHASFTDLQWVIDVYSLALAARSSSGWWCSPQPRSPARWRPAPAS